MRIGICDDDIAQLQTISEILSSYRTPDNEPVIFDCFSNASNLLDSLKPNSYDVLLLDILMPGFTGMDAAKDIRAEYESLPIIFLTSSPEFAVESYRVRAFDYLLKPIDPVFLTKALNRVYEHIVRSDPSFTFRLGRTVSSIPFNRIEYIEVRNHTLIFHQINGEELSLTGTLSDYEEIFLNREEFFKTHRSFIVNLDNVRSVNNRELVTISESPVPIARNLVHSTKEAFFKRLHNAIRM